jgi:branched-chain amino acid transport system permease protein
MRKVSPATISLFLGLLVYLFWTLSRSKTGRAFRAIREKPEAASTMGIDVVASRRLAFLMSALIAGAAGAFYAHSVGSLDNGDFRFTRAVDVLSFAVVGGAGQWFGPLLGAGLLTALPIFLRDSLGASIGFLRDFAQLPDILTGLALLLVIVFLPGGLAQSFPVRPGRILGRGGRGVGGPSAGEAAGAAGDVPGLERPGAVAPAVRGEASLLVVHNLTRVFGGVEALSGVSLRFEEGHIHGLIGPNGAGKTTFINLVSGLASPSAGRIVWQGREIQGRPPHLIARSGIARTYQSIRLFAEMSVRENVIVGRHAHIRTDLLTTWMRLPRERREETAAFDDAVRLLEGLGLSELADRPAGALAYGDQRRVEIARALSLHPRLLLLDEPAAGMNEAETERLGRFLLDLKRKGYTLIVVEHHMDLIMGVCDRIAVLNFGRTIAEGTPAEVAGNELVREAYLGRD